MFFVLSRLQHSPDGSATISLKDCVVFVSLFVSLFPFSRWQQYMYRSAKQRLYGESFVVRFCWTTLWNESQSDGRICVVSQMMSLDVINRHTVWDLICMLNHNMHNVDNKERSRDDNLWLFPSN